MLTSLNAEPFSTTGSLSRVLFVDSSSGGRYISLQAVSKSCDLDRFIRRAIPTFSKALMPLLKGWRKNLKLGMCNKVLYSVYLTTALKKGKKGRFNTGLAGD